MDMRRALPPYHLLAVLVLLLAAWPAVAGTERGIAFRIEGEPPGVLLGSVHLGEPSMYPLPAALQQAYERADTLVVEADIVEADMVQLARLVARRGMYGRGEDLESELPRRVWQDVTAAAERYGLRVDMLRRQRPWLAAQTLTAAAAQAQGFSERLGVDRHFLDQAHEDGKRIVELEGPEAQLTMLAGLPEADQQALLAYTVEQMTEGDIPVAELIEAWRSGRVEALQRQVEAQFPRALDGIYQRLIVERNRAMARRIDELLASGRRILVVVGAGHLTGDVGLVALLRERGYRVDQL